MKNKYLLDIRKTIETVSQKVDAEFSGLSTDQMNWKPDADSWSIAECLDHLIVTNCLYFKQFDQLLKENYKPSFIQKFSPFHSFFGNMLKKAVDPANTKKVKTMNIFSPATSQIQHDIIEKFHRQQQEMLSYLDKTAHLDHQKVKINSPLTKIMTYSLHDAWQILSMHEERHFNQAMKVKGMGK